MYLLDAFVYLGIIASGISGALIGISKKLDLFGVICLCVATSLGGGIIRDALVGNVPPTAFIVPSYFVVSLTAGLLTWFFYNSINRLGHIIVISDAIGLGVFTAVGSNTAITLFDNEPFLVVSMGLITGIGGGVLRDLFAQEIPYVFRKEIYAVASILGSISLILTYDLFPHMVSLYICLGVTFALRMVSVILKLNAPVLLAEINDSISTGGRSMEGLSKKLQYKAGKATVVNAPDGFQFDMPSEQHLDGKFDFILLFIRDAKELHEWTSKAIKALNGDAVFWICYPKQSSKIKTDINRDIIGKVLIDTTGYRLVSNVAIDETWSALRVRHQNIVKSK